MDGLFSEIVKLGLALIPFLLTLFACLLLLVFSHKLLLGNKSLNLSEKFPRQIILAILYVMSLIALIIALPIEKDTRNQVLGLLGILLSGVIAFSSTSIVSNIMAGLVFRITKPFRTGDFIRVGNFFGRVSEKGIFDTELQTEQRELIAFANSFLLSQPIQVVRSSGTIISANLSLGYDVHHSKVEAILLKAADEAGLIDPFTQIIELGNFAISYRISGLLTEVKSMISARSKLHAAILDHLHEADIEIVSPNMIASRPLDPSAQIIAKAPNKTSREEETPVPEEIVFDKAEAAEQQEQKEQNLREQIVSLEKQINTTEGEQAEKLKEQLAKKQLKLESLLQAQMNKEE